MNLFVLQHHYWQQQMIKAVKAEQEQLIHVEVHKMSIAYETARDFLYREARYLDDKDWDSWLELYAADATFWMPAWDDADQLTEDPQREISLIWYGNRGGLEDRVFASAPSAQRHDSGYTHLAQHQQPGADRGWARASNCASTGTR